MFLNCVVSFCLATQLRTAVFANDNAQREDLRQQSNVSGSGIAHARALSMVVVSNFEDRPEPEFVGSERRPEEPRSAVQLTGKQTGMEH